MRIRASNRRRKQTAVEKQRVRWRTKTNRRSEDARMLGRIFRFRVLEPHFARFPMHRSQKTDELRDCRQGNLAIMPALGQRRSRVIPLKTSNVRLNAQLE